MSYDFHVTSRVRRTKKVHCCEMCGRDIDAGSAAVKGAGKYGGDFYTSYQHLECQVAGIAYAELTGCWGEDFMWFQYSWEKEDDPWLIKNHPIVAKRLLGSSPEIESSIAAHIAKANEALEQLANA